MNEFNACGRLGFPFSQSLKSFPRPPRRIVLPPHPSPPARVPQFTSTYPPFATGMFQNGNNHSEQSSIPCQLQSSPSIAS